MGVNGAHIGHVSLEDVYRVLEPITSSGPGGQSYQAYENLQIPQESWYAPFAADPANPQNVRLGWAMRNSGLSPDFAQSARYALWYLHNEQTCVWQNATLTPGHTGAYCNCNQGPSPNYRCLFGGDRLPQITPGGTITGYAPDQATMAGVMMIQVRVIAQLLSITGPIKVGCPYDVWVTAANLQDTIHYYQETAAGRQQGTHACGTGGSLSDATKRFTALLTQALQAKLKTISKTALFRFAGELVTDLHTKDIQLYFTDPRRDQTVNNGASAWGNNPQDVYPPDPAAAQFLEHYQVANELYQGSDDALAFNRADLGGWKMERWVQLHLHDQITIGRDQSVTHHLQAHYTFAIPPITVIKDHGGQPDLTQTQQAIFGTVYNAGYRSLYTEYWRLYTAAQPTNVVDTTSAMRPVNFALGPYPTSDVPTRAFFQGEVSYQWSVDASHPTVQWGYQGYASANGVYYDQEPPALQWQVQHVIHAGRYTLHVQPQSGVTTSIDVQITGPCGTQRVQGALTTNQVIQVPVSHC